MARRKSVARPRRQIELTSDNEGEKKEEEQQVPKSDENKIDSSSSNSTDSEEKARRRRQEIAKGKRPMEFNEKKKGKGLNLKLDFNAVMLALSSNKGVVIGKSQTEAVVKPKASETKATVEPKAKRGRSRRQFAVNSNYFLRSKGMAVDVASETNADRKCKRKEEETDDLQGPVTDSEEACKKIKKEPKNDDDRTDDDDGTVGGAHTNVLRAGLEIAAGN